MDTAAAGPPYRAVVPRDFDQWRATARTLLHANVPPDDIVWEDVASRQHDLFGGPDDRAALPLRAASNDEADATLRVPRDFLRLARIVSAHADPERHAILYRVLWRLTHGEPHLLDMSVDRDVLALHVRERAVRRAAHKTKAFVRFRRVEDADGERFVAWLDPEHDVLPLVAPFFARRFPAMRWAILTPIRTAVWDGEEVNFAAGAPRSAAPSDDDLDALWRTYYAGIFNPARVKVRAMQREMPRRWWGDLPEARLIPALIREAPARVAAMHARAEAEAAALARGEAPRRGRRRRESWDATPTGNDLAPHPPAGGARLAPFNQEPVAESDGPTDPSPGANRLEERL